MIFFSITVGTYVRRHQKRFRLKCLLVGYCRVLSSSFRRSSWLGTVCAMVNERETSKLVGITETLI